MSKPSKLKHTTPLGGSDDTEFLKSFAIRNVSANITLEEQEAAANALVREALQQSKQYQAEHNYKLPDHLEQFRLEYEKAAVKSKVSIPVVSQLSPRTKREASLLPKPTFYEEQKIKKFVELSKKTDTNALYNGLLPKQKAEDVPRFSAIANAKMILIPHNVQKDVGKDSTQYFETMEKAVKRKQAQDEKMAQLFDKYSDAPKSMKVSSGAAPSHTTSRKGSVLPKLPVATSLTGPLTANSSLKSLSPLVPQQQQQPQQPQQQVSPVPMVRSAIGRAGAVNLSKSLTSLGLQQSTSKPSTANYTPLSSIDPHYDEKLEPANTPLLYSMFQPNPLAQREAHYSTENMATILEQRYVAENVRLQRIMNKLNQKSETEYLNLFSAKVLDETGLDLNKEYNKIRNYTVYLMQLSFHFYNQRMRAGLVQWHSQVAKIRAARIEKASKIVIRAVKLGVFLMTQNEKRRRQNAQSDFEAKRLREIEALHRAKVKIIHRAMFLHTRMRKIRHLLRMRRAATTLQRRVRGMIGRRVAHEWKNLHAFLSHNALMIQCAYRCRLARRKVTLTRKLSFVRRWLEELQTLRAGRLRHMIEEGAELYIAKAYRTLVFRRKLKNLIYWNHFRCAVLIQRMYKGYRVRKKYHAVWALHKARMVIEHRCALKIQLCIRCALARRHLHTLAFKKNKLQQERQRKKLMLLATSNKVSFTWKFVKLYRKMYLFRIDLLHKKATIIQQVWRGRHGRQRAFIVRIRKAIEAINVKFRHRVKCVKLIQRNWRGFITRLNLLRKKKQKMVLKIQTLWRLVRAKRRVRQLKKDNLNARILTRKLCRLVRRHRFHIRYIWQQQRAKYVIRIQAWMRRACARCRVTRLLSARRQAVESQMFITTRLNQLLSATQLQILRDTLNVAIGHRIHAFSGEPCVCLGPVQAVFTLAACSKGRTDTNTLFTNKADSITLIRMLHKIAHLMDNPDKKHGKTKKPKKPHPITSRLSILQELDAGRIVLPAVQRKLKANHIDILFNRAKTETGNLLNYSDFVECLKLIAEAHYGKKDPAEALVEAESSLYPTAEPSVALTGRPDSPPTAAPPTARVTEYPSAHSGQASGAHRERLTSSAQRFQHAGQRRKHRLPRAKLQCSHHELFLGTEPDVRLALVLNIFASLRYEEWMTQILEWLETESLGRVGLFVTRIQSVARRHMAKKTVAVRSQAREEQRRNARLFTQVTKAQSLVRMFVYRFRAARKAQRTLIQYCPHFGEPYWYNPQTEVKSWTKPKVLRHLNSYSLALPEEGLENVVNCSYCNKPAEVNCNECEDSMCRVCYDSMHCKGARLKHRPTKIPHCAYCKFQVATKSCLTCIITDPVRGTMRESVAECVRGNYCDTCFIHEHDSGEKALHLHKQRRKDLKNILAYSSQAYLVNQYLHQRIITSHHYEDMVQSCEECNTRSSTWRCQDCNQVYCSSCLVGLHSMGGPFARHKAEQLPYFTPEMHVSFKKDINKQLFRLKMDKLNKIEKARRTKHLFDCAVKIQAWWRMLLYGHLGRKDMKRRRRRQRIAYKAYKRDTLEIRNTSSYRFQALFGRAPPLSSDNKEDVALRQLNIFRKYAARTFILENKEDWGYYRVSRTKPQKGIPKTGFAWGTPEELLEQATEGGYRVPGRVMVVPGEQVFNTTCDLTRVLHVGERVRIRNRLFGVVKITPTSIRVNRYWRAGDDNARPSEEGELMYRAPMYLDEPRRGEYNRKYHMYSIMVENPISQTGIIAYRWYSARMLRFALYMVRANKRNGLREEEQSWRAASVHYADAVRRADSLLSTPDQMKPLYGTERVYWKSPPLEEDALTLGLKKHHRKGLLEKIEEAEDDISALLDEDDYSEDSWGNEGQLRLKSSAQNQRGVLKNNRVLPTDESSRESGFEPSAKLDENSLTGSLEGSATSSKLDILSIVSNKLFNTEERLAVKAAADALYEQEKGDQPKAAADVETLQQQRKERKNKKKFVKPEEPWYASAEQLDARAEREDKMTLHELALEADDWKECVDIMTENIYFQNVKTNELFTTVPRAVAAKRQLEFENSKNKKNYDDAQKRIQKLEDIIKNRKLITGGRKK